jgi:hypothetical protein
MNNQESEATKIEQARAFSEVMVQAKLAKEFPRNMDEVFRKIEETFQSDPEIADASKFSYSRGNTQITGYTIQFARAVAECVGNIHFSIKELARNERQTEILVQALELESNTMQSRSIIVRHIQYAASEPKSLEKERDIYENNANVAARRLRECILEVLPKPAINKAKAIVEEILEGKYGDEEKRLKYAAEYLKRLEDNHGISYDRVVANRGNRPPEMWVKEDFAYIAMANKLLKANSIAPEKLFPEVEQSGAKSIKREISNQKF